MIRAACILTGATIVGIIRLAAKGAEMIAAMAYGLPDAEEM